MPLDMTKPDIINFYVESIEKTNKIRLRWNQMYGGDILKAATFRGEEKGHCTASLQKTLIEAGLPATTRDMIASNRLRKTKRPHDVKPAPVVADMRKTHTIPQMGLGDPKEDPRLARPDSDPSPDPLMRPVPPKQSTIIYNGTALSPLGRLEYLKLRQRMNPEDKYYLPEVVGWDIGWRLKDSAQRNFQRFGRAAVLTKDTCKVGPQPDPKHYTSMNPDGKLTCKE